MKNSIGIGMLALCVVFIGAGQAQEKVLATVGPEKITQVDFKDRLEELPSQFRGYYASDQGKAKFLDQLVQERLFYIKAVQSGIDKEFEVQDAVERAKKNIVVSYYVNKALKNVTVTDKEILDYYNAHPEKYKASERVRASHILLDTDVAAQSALAQVKKGADFDTLAKQLSKDPGAKETADVGWFERGQMVKPFEDAAFLMKVGEVSLPVKTQYGYHIIKLTGREPGAQKNFDQVKATIREQLLREAQNKKLDAIVTELKTKTPVTIDQTVLKSY